MQHTIVRVVPDRGRGLALSHYNLARGLSLLIALLAAIASLAGLFVPELYRGLGGLKPAVQGQDLVTLLALPFLVWAVLASAHGAARPLIVWLGVLSYVWYTYTGAAFAYPMNALFLVYVALFSLSVCTLVALVGDVDVAALARRFATAPRKPVAAFLLFEACALGIGELMQVLAYLIAGTVPSIMVLAQSQTCFVFVLDLGVVVPLLALSAAWLWRRYAWGYLLGGTMLIKGATMGLALVAMNWFTAAAGGPSDGLLPLWVAIAAGSLAFTAWFLRDAKA